MKSAQYYIDSLDLVKHPEGGFFKETYRSTDLIDKESLPLGFSGPRNISTTIYYLLKKNQFSTFHRIKSDEIWHFYDGGVIEIFELDKEHGLIITLLGRDIDQGQKLQYSVKANNWFAARPKRDSEFALVGCTVSPGFDFSDFDMANRDELISDFPTYKELIIELTNE